MAESSLDCNGIWSYGRAPLVQYYRIFSIELLQLCVVSRFTSASKFALNRTRRSLVLRIINERLYFDVNCVHVAIVSGLLDVTMQMQW